MRSIDTVLKKTFPKSWYNYKKNKIEENAKQAVKNYEN
jgi:hypothetical protein